MAPRSAVVLGKGPLAMRVGGWFLRAPEWRLAAVVPVIPEPTWTDSLTEWAGEHQVTTVASGDYADLGAACEREYPDLAVSVFYDRILSPAFIDACGRVLNIHNGPLPRYRGVSPINWALKNGETSHGVTIHEVTPGIDEGPVVAQLSYSIYPERDEVEDVLGRAYAYAWTLFEQTLPLLDRIEPRPQDESRATYYSAADNERLGERRYFTRALSGGAAAAAPYAARPA